MIMFNIIKSIVNNLIVNVIRNFFNIYPFLKRGIQLSIDFNNPQMIYDILKAEISYEEEEELINSRIFEALGGYAPTFGIVGAVVREVQRLNV